MLRILPILLLFTGSLIAKEFGERVMMSEEECADVIYCPPSTTPTSIVALLGSPSVWKGKSIRVFGWITYDRHGSTLYMSTEHCHGMHGEYGVGVRLDLLSDSDEYLSSLEPCQPTDVEGVYWPTENRDPVPGVIRYRDFWPGIIDAEYLFVSENDT